MSLFRPLLSLAGALTLVGALAGCPAESGGGAPKFPNAIMTPAPKEVAEVSLIDSDGKPFQLADLKGKWVWMYFGFANCPDVCPAAMDYMAAEYQLLTHQDQVVPVFVSVDPQRDTPATLKTYTGYYSPAIRGVTGEKAAIDALTQSVGAGYVLDKPATPGGHYNVSHTNMVFVLNPEGELAAYYVPLPKTGEMAKDFNALTASS